MSGEAKKFTDHKWVKDDNDAALPPLKEVTPRYFDNDRRYLTEVETTSQVRLLKENPWIIVGCGATLGCLLMGLHSFFRGNVGRSQFMMRGRVVAQGLTVAAVMLAAFHESEKKNGIPPSDK